MKRLATGALVEILLLIRGISESSERAVLLRAITTLQFLQVKEYTLLSSYRQRLFPITARMVMLFGVVGLSVISSCFDTYTED